MNGCQGGYIEGPYAYLIANGSSTEKDYPYTSGASGLRGRCKKAGGTFKLKSFKAIQPGNCSAVISNLASAPLSIAIAGYRLQFYSSGIFDDCNTFLDHAVVLVGYKAGVGWKIKNSWGTDWGINGFAWIAEKNDCGICKSAFSAQI